MPWWLTLRDSDPLPLALVAVAVVLICAQLCGALLERLGQPRVVGEIFSGIALGPSLLGQIAPGLERALFGQSVLPQLNLLAQLGLILFMFLIGLELNPRLLQGRLQVAVRISLVGILLPLVLGIALAHRLELWQPQLLPGDHRPAGALFVGVAMAITAFPVLVRILRDRGMQDQPIGVLATAVAAIDDLVTWFLLAVVVALARNGSFWAALPTLVFAGLWALLLLVGLRPLRRRLAVAIAQPQGLSPALEVLLLSGALLSGAITEWMGVHVIYGAFLWGLAMPRDGALEHLLENRLRLAVLRLMLPLFFAISGLNTRIDAINTPALWGVAALVLLLAVAGKFVGGWVMARLSGIPSRDAQALGWLMNTRGLTELVVLNVGLSLGVITPVLFSIGVLVALTTTVAAGPLLSRLGYHRQLGLSVVSHHVRQPSSSASRC